MQYVYARNVTVTVPNILQIGLSLYIRSLVDTARLIMVITDEQTLWLEPVTVLHGHVFVDVAEWVICPDWDFIGKRMNSLFIPCVWDTETQWDSSCNLTLFSDAPISKFLILVWSEQPYSSCAKVCEGLPR